MFPVCVCVCVCIIKGHIIWLLNVQFSCLDDLYIARSNTTTTTNYNNMGISSHFVSVCHMVVDPNSCVTN